MSDQLKPCPFCQSHHAPRLYAWHEGSECRYTVLCLNCGAQGPKKEIGPLAIAAWNRRAPDKAAAYDNFLDEVPSP